MAALVFTRITFSMLDNLQFIFGLCSAAWISLISAIEKPSQHQPYSKRKPNTWRQILGGKYVEADTWKPATFKRSRSGRMNKAS